MKKLRIGQDGVRLNLLNRIASTFPYITHLDLRTFLLNSSSRFALRRTEAEDIFSTLWENLNFGLNLKELVLKFQPADLRYEIIIENCKFEMDSLFSGLSVERIRDISRVGEYEQESEDIASEISLGRGSILNLKGKQAFVNKADDCATLHFICCSLQL